ncbi:hypothetical protein [Thioalkalivibrio sp.]|uniref:hypothetical protein n=1 Tax=Thioalkalivibrio sp. TaxID=2093813 RepID=UPI0035663A59
MATTTNYSLNKPTVGGDTDTWGSLLNDSMDAIDTQMKANADAVAALGDPITIDKGGTGATSASTARTALGLGSAATQNDTKYAHRANNLNDLNDAAAARLNLGAIGNNAAELTAGTLPDARLSSNIVRTSRAVNTGGGLTGGGNLSSNRTLSINVGVTAGTGLTGGGTLTSTRTINLVTTAGAVGTYGFFVSTGGTTAFGGTVAGSNLNPAGIGEAMTNAYTDSVTISGTWRCMGYAQDPGVTDNPITLFQRVS